MHFVTVPTSFVSFFMINSARMSFSQWKLSPKSINFRLRLSFVKKSKFSGFKSLCATFCLWQQLRACRICPKMYLASRSEKDPVFYSFSNSQPPQHKLQLRNQVLSNQIQIVNILIDLVDLEYGGMIQFHQILDLIFDRIRILDGLLEYFLDCPPWPTYQLISCFVNNPIGSTPKFLHDEEWSTLGQNSQLSTMLSVRNWTKLPLRMYRSDPSIFCPFPKLLSFQVLVQYNALILILTTPQYYIMIQLPRAFTSACKLMVLFSTFKTKFQKLKSGAHQSSVSVYDAMCEFQSSLQYLEKLKYKKAVVTLQNKIERIYQKQQPQSPKLHHLVKQLNASISYQLFYELQNKQYIPLQDNQINKMDLNTLYKHLVLNQSRFRQNLDKAIQILLANPDANEGLYEGVGVRCGYLEDQLAMNVFEGYPDVLREAEREALMKKKKALNKLKDGEKEQKIFTKDYKFTIKEGLSPEDNYKASQIGKIIMKYGLTGQKIRLFSQKSLSNEAYKSLTPFSLKNHLFILACLREKIAQLNETMFKIYDILSPITASPDGEPYEQYRGQMGPMNSLLFYLLSNKIENYELYGTIIRKLVENSIQFKKKRKEGTEIRHIDRFDRQLFCLMLKLVKSKYELTPQMFKKELDLPQSYQLQANQQAILKSLSPVSTNSCIDFQKYLTKKEYKFDKTIISESSQQTMFTIEQKNFLCLNLSRIDKKTQKVNGIGEIILENYKITGQNVKIINPLVVHKCERLSQKEEYFKTKLKGIKQPELNRNRRFDF